MTVLLPRNYVEREAVAFRWRAIPYTVIADLEGAQVKATSALNALRKYRVSTGFKRGARVSVFVPAIVHARRVRPRGKARLL